MATLPRFDSRCCGAIGSSPSHRPGCKFEIAAQIYASPAARKARQVIADSDFNSATKVISFREVMNTLIQLSGTIERYAIGIAP